MGFDGISWLCAFIKYTKNYIKTIIYVTELILTLFTPLDIKYKKLNAKNLLQCIFR